MGPERTPCQAGDLAPLLRRPRHLLPLRARLARRGRPTTADLVDDIIATQGTPPGWLHADGGAAMTSKPLSSLLADLDVTRSRISKDNPYSEAQFKTMKYTPDYPARFDSLGHARAWMEGFMTWYNHEHRHSRIGLHTPASVHSGSGHDIRAARQATLDAAWLAHPNGSPTGPPHPGYPNGPPSTTPRNEFNPNLRRLETSHLT